MRNKYLVGLAGSALLLMGTAFAQQSPTNSTDRQNSSAYNSSQTQLSSTDRNFIRESAEGSLAEVKLAKMVEGKTNDPAIRQYAKDIINDHTQMLDQLKANAPKLGMTLPTQPSAQQQATYDRLSKLSGKQLDAAFVKNQLRDHKSDIKKADTVLETTQNNLVKTAATSALPHLQDHIRIAEDLAGSMQMPGRAGLNNPTEAVSAQALSHSAGNLNAKNQAANRSY